MIVGSERFRYCRDFVLRHTAVDLYLYHMDDSFVIHIVQVVEIDVEF